MTAATNILNQELALRRQMKRKQDKGLFRNILSQPQRMATERDDNLSFAQRAAPVIFGEPEMVVDPNFWKGVAKEATFGLMGFPGDIGYLAGGVAPPVFNAFKANWQEGRPLTEGLFDNVGDPTDYAFTSDTLAAKAGMPFTNTPNEIRGRVLGGFVPLGAYTGLAENAGALTANALAPRTLSRGPMGRQVGATVYHGSPWLLSDRPTLEQYQRSQRPSKKIKRGSAAKKLRDEISAKRKERRAFGLLGDPPMRGGDWANRQGAPDLQRRLEKRKRVAMEKAKNEQIADWVLTTGASWNAKFADEVRQAGKLDYGFEEAVNRANMEAVPRLLKKQGWTMRHASEGRDGRKSSRYLVSPDGNFELRLSDHDLPETPERRYRGTTRWDDEIVLTGREHPEDVVRAITQAPGGEFEASDILDELSSQRPHFDPDRIKAPKPLGAQPIARGQRGAIGPLSGSADANPYRAKATAEDFDAMRAQPLGYEPPTRGSKFVGAPPTGVESIDDVLALRNNMLTEIQHYANDADFDWYRNAGDYLAKNVADRGERERMVRALALLSADFNAPANANASVRALREAALGQKPRVGRYPNVMSDRLEAAWNADAFDKNLKGVDNKIQNFYWDLRRFAFPNDPPLGPMTSSTIDRQMYRLGGWPEGTIKGSTEPQYRFQQDLVADANRVYNEQMGTDMQAEMWAAQKRRAEGLGLDQPVGNFHETMARNSLTVPYETVPGRASPVGIEFANASLDTQRAWSDESMRLFTRETPEGNLVDEIAEDLGISVYRLQPSYGYYDGGLHPNFISVQTSFPAKGGKAGELTMDDAMDYALAQKYVWDQDAVPIYRPAYEAPNARTGDKGITLRFDHDLTEQEMQGLGDALRGTVLGDDAGFTAVSPSEVHVVNFGYLGIKDKDFFKAMDDIAGNEGLDYGLKEHKRFTSKQAEYLESAEWPEAAIEKRLGERGRPDLLGRLRDRRARARQAEKGFQEGLGVQSNRGLLSD